MALGFVAGFTGSEIERIMSKDGIPHDFLPLKTGFSRIDVQMVDAIESSINGIGPLATQEDIDALCEKLQNLQDGDTIVLSGSVPRGAKDNVYGEILRSVSHKDLYVVVDAKRPLLLHTLKYRPFLIKPNMQEMTDIFFQDMSSVSTDDIVRYMKTLQSMGHAIFWCPWLCRRAAFDRGRQNLSSQRDEGQGLQHGRLRRFHARRLPVRLP